MGEHEGFSGVVRLNLDVHARHRSKPASPRLAVPVSVTETAGIERMEEPVSVGVPFPRGAVFDSEELCLMAQAAASPRLQARVLARWPDGSIKWGLLDFLASVGPRETARYEVRMKPASFTMIAEPLVEVRESGAELVVQTGLAAFVVDTKMLKPFNEVRCRRGREGLPRGQARTLLTDSDGVEYVPRIQEAVVEAGGPVRVTLRLGGAFEDSGGSALASFDARLSFFAGRALATLSLTVRNTRAARHDGGFWDLGDHGAIYFRDLSLEVAAGATTRTDVEVRCEPGRECAQGSWSALELYQDSSGGAHWDSENHMNRHGQVTTTLPGYRIVADGKTLHRGSRATPVVSIRQEDGRLSAAIQRFWQNFPKALEVAGSMLRIRLFPQQYGDVHELQPGEQKTHTLYLSFEEEYAGGLEWTREPLIPVADPCWMTMSGALPYLLPRDQWDFSASAVRQAASLIDSAVSGTNTFVHRREVIDEYGWRHFGDLWADHETVGAPDGRPRVSHYNNQYDVIFGAAMHYMSTGDRAWFELMQDYARHVIDIDLYHTGRDRPAFNRGMFWHTEHYSEAKTATHRAYSRLNVGDRDPLTCGGGPSSEHNYTSGLLLYYYLTGDSTAAESVRELADWVCTMDDGARTPFWWLDRRPTGCASMTVSRDYHGPGRGAGNSINALLDAFVLTGQRHYLTKAEALIRRCIHPREDISRRDLPDIERRWSYTVFLQVLGKYLDLKIAQDEADWMYGYGVESLLHYARWMERHEVPYSQVLDRVEIPTETWPAQDIRKCNVFLLAAKYAADPERERFLDRAGFFFQACLHDLAAYPTCTFTRPVVLMMTNAHLYPYFLAHGGESAPPPEPWDYGFPLAFKPQLHWLQRLRQRLFALRAALVSRALPRGAAAARSE